MKCKMLILCVLQALVLVAVPLLSRAADPQRPVRVACVGNSITYGTALADREHEAYPVQLQALLGEGYEVGSFGKPGATLLRRGYRPYFEQEEFRQAMAFKADIAVIHLGVNDTDPRAWPNYRDEFVRDYLALIDSLRAANPKVRVLVASITPIADRHHRFQSGTKEWQDLIREAIADVAQIAGAELIDFFSPLYPYPWMFPDAIHPDAEGAGILARTVYGGITGDYGGLRMPATYTDNMVLQRRVPLHITGRANAARRIRVRLMRDAEVVAEGTATANNRGEWDVALPAQEAAEGLTLSVESASPASSPVRRTRRGKPVPNAALNAAVETRTFRNVAVGEVWLCSGQSNMAFRLNQSADAGNPAADPSLRLFDMKEYWATDACAWPAEAIDSVLHLRYFRPTSWQQATPEGAQRFSAVAWHFGRMLRDSLGVPVGLICNAVGGSTTESWISRQTLETRLPKILDRWLHNDYIQDWCRGRAAQNLGLDLRKVSDDFRHRHPYEPCYLFEAGILPLGKYAIKGVVWYQGESNAHNVEAHERLFPLLVSSWREYFGQPGTMPFYFVQLSSLNRPSWPWFRDSQRRLAAAIPHTGFAVTTDVGDSLDVHPRLKQPVGQRLARLALHDAYGMARVVPCGPQPVSAVAAGSGVEVRFDHASGLQTSDGGAPLTFEVAEFEGYYFPARATISGTSVVLDCPEVSRPRFVRYGWQPFTRANVVNAERLPLSTFRLEVE